MTHSLLSTYRSIEEFQGVMTDRAARLQTALDRGKAMKQYEALRRANVVVKAVVITELKDGSYHVLGQNLTPEEIAPLLMVGAEALTQAEANRRIVKLVAHQEPEKRGEHNRSRPRVREITKDADGVLVPPRGENFISCGECHHPQFHVLHHNADDTLARYACSHCGNEIKNIPILHQGGTA
jgi:hypothetical protein